MTIIIMAPYPPGKLFHVDLDTELWQLGVFAKTEHKEVAPGQYELAPVFADPTLLRTTTSW